MEKSFTSNKLNLLSIPYKFIITKDVLLFGSDDLEHRPRHGSVLVGLAGGGHGVALLRALHARADVHHEWAAGLHALHHHAVAPAEQSVGVVTPGHSLVGRLVLRKRLSERQLTLGFLLVKVLLLDSVQFKVFVPVSNSGFVAIFWSSL